MKLKEHEGILPMKTEAIKAKTVDVIIAGVALIGFQLSDGSYRVSLSQALEAFGISRGRVNNEILGLLEIPQTAITSLKVNSRKGFRDSTNTRAYLLTVEQFAKCLGFIASKGSQQAIDVLVATANETLQRRFDYAFGIKKTEVQYEASLANLYRRLRDEHKKQYVPYLTHWTKLDYPRGSAINYGVRTNQLKVAAGIRSLAPVDYMTTEELMVWNAAEIRYDSFRRAGYWHERALKEIATSV